MTNGDKIRKMTDEELANIVICPYEWCSHFQIACKECKQKWLDTVIDEPKPEPKKPSVPKPIKYIIEGGYFPNPDVNLIVNEINMIVTKVNEIITYLEEQNNDGT